MKGILNEPNRAGGIRSSNTILEATDSLIESPGTRYFIESCQSNPFGSYNISSTSIQVDIKNHKDDISIGALIGTLFAMLALGVVLEIFGTAGEEGSVSRQALCGLPELLGYSAGGVIASAFLAAIPVGGIAVFNRLRGTPYRGPKRHFLGASWIIFLLSNLTRHSVFSGLVVTGLAIFAVVKAFRTRATGWFIASLVGVTWLSILGYGFISGISGNKVPTLSKNNELQPLKGLNGVYSVQIPSKWTIDREESDFDLLAHHDALYVGVIAEEANLEDPETVANLARDHLKEVATDLIFGKQEPFILDGRKWVQFTASAHIEKMPVSYLNYVYSGSEGTFQVIGWTIQNLFERDITLMREVMQTFRFAEKAVSPVTSLAPPARLSTEEAMGRFDIGAERYRNQEYAEAYKAWEALADHNILEVYNNLGYLNYYGLGVTQNQEEGLRQWRIAAENGFPESQIHLSEAYSEGISLQKDLAEAYAWAKAAAYFTPQVSDDRLRNSFDEVSNELIVRLSSELSVAERERADNKAVALIERIVETQKSTKFIRRFPMPASSVEREQTE